MSRFRIFFGALVGIGVLAAAATFLLRGSYFTPAPTPAEQWSLVKTYCLDCHNAAEASGGLVLEGRSPTDVAHDPKAFEAVVRKILA